MSELALSIETRLGALQEIVRQMGACLSRLHPALPNKQELDAHPVGSAYSLKGEEGQRAAVQLLVLLGAFVSEARSLFENVAEFRAQVQSRLLGTPLGSKAAWFSDFADLFRDPGAADKLGTLRHEIRHVRAPWLRFLVFVGPDGPTYEPELRLDWRPEAEAAEDFVSMTALKSLWFELWSATMQARDVLIGDLGNYKR